VTCCGGSASAFAPQRDDDALALRLERRDVPGHRREHVAAGLGPLGGKIAPLLGADIDERPLPFRHRERSQPRQRGGFEPCAPFGFAEIEPLGRQRLIGRARSALGERLLTRLVVVLDLTEPFAGGVLGQRFEYHRGTHYIVEQRLEPVLEQRQPMLHAAMATAFAHRVIEEVVGRGGAEGRHVTKAEAPDRFRGELEFGHRHEIERAQLVGRALAFGVEAADRLQRVAEKIEPHRLRHARRVEVDDAAAHRIVAGLAHGRGTREAVELEPFGDAVHGQHIAGRDRKRLPRNEVAGRHALQGSVDGREQHRRAVAALHTREPGQCCHALRDEARVRRDPVIGQAVPRRKLLHGDIRCKKIECAGERGHARAVTADDHHGRRRRVGARRQRAGEIGDNEAFGAVGDACQRERAARDEELGGIARHAHLAPSPLRLNSRSRRNSAVS